jgi:hypothetical protein
MARIARSRLARISTRLAHSSGSHTNSDTLVGMPFSSVWYSPRHLSCLLSQRNVLCLNRNHLFRSIRLRFAHDTLPTQRNLPNWLVREQLMEAIKANLLSHQIGSFSQRSRYWSRFVTPAGSEASCRGGVT